MVFRTPIGNPEATIEELSRRIAEQLVSYDPVRTTHAWFDTLRAVEDCINLPTSGWRNGTQRNAVFGLKLLQLVNDPKPLVAVRPILAARFSETFANRFVRLMMQAAAIAVSFASEGHPVAREFATVGDLRGYLQSRRRHFVALLHCLPVQCRGSRAMHELDTLNVLLPLIELHGLQIVGAQHARLIEASRERLGLPAEAAIELPMLDPLFLEPERSRITEMPMDGAASASIVNREEQPSDRLFSAAELRNDIALIEAAYAEFDLAGGDFAPAAELVRRLSRDFVERDFWIVVPPAALRALLDAVRAPEPLRATLISQPHGYVDALDSYSPFVFVDGLHRSSVALLSRFLYHWRARCLDRNKRFQIRAGFIFEKAVAAELEDQGFAVQEITRINRHEFDVVTLRAGAIWNVQCKNNFKELSRIEGDANLFARYNAQLVRAYRRALTKEERREDVLKDHLGIDEINHMVVSRFPVVTDEPRIVAYSRIDRFSARADAVSGSTRTSAGQ